MKRLKHKAKREIKTLLFDLDNTLYPDSCGLLAEVGRRITLFTMQQFSMTEDAAYKMQKHYWRRYGSSLVGYVFDEGVDPKKYQDFVYDIDYKKFIKRDNELIELFKSLNYRNIVYTNGGILHAKAVLNALGIEDAFDKLVGIENVRWLAKPMPQSYREMLLHTGIHPAETVFFEDQTRNLAAAKKFGMTTVLVGIEAVGTPEPGENKADLQIESIKELKIL